MKEASLSIVEDVENGRYLMIRNHRGINKGCLNFPVSYTHLTLPTT